MLVITLGDPYSINVEAVHDLTSELIKLDYPVVMLGNWWHFCDQSHRLNKSVQSVSSIESWSQAKGKGLFFISTTDGAFQVKAEKLTKKQRGSIASASLLYLRTLELDKNQPLAVLSAPIDKAACHAAGFDFPAQTEYFASLWQAEAAMILSGPKLRVALATNHCALSEVSNRLSSGLILGKLKILYRFLCHDLGIASPKIGVCGLNPHAGDQGMFGDEEETTIAPAIAQFNELGHHGVAYGPLSADTLFFKAYEGVYDGVLAMYHDQGLGPLKLIHFYDAVNITAGLKHLRVSPDHGPASEHFLLNTANMQSFHNAFNVARDYLAHRTSVDAD